MENQLFTPLKQHKASYFSISYLTHLYADENMNMMLSGAYLQKPTICFSFR